MKLTPKQAHKCACRVMADGCKAVQGGAVERLSESIALNAIVAATCTVLYSSIVLDQFLMGEMRK